MLFVKKGSKLYSILYNKCPRCHEGDMYDTSTFSFRRSFDMRRECSHCNQRYELETGFYWGAMFISYAIVVAYMLLGFCFLFFLLDIYIWYAFSFLVIGSFFLYVWFFRVSRAIWINFFIDYDKAFADKN